MVFLEGLVSFFSPCVIPLIPLYMGYLAGSAKTENEDGTIGYEKKSILLHTIFFVLGISVAFFILGLGFSALGSAVKEYRDVISKVGGLLIILLGLKQIGVLKINFLNKEIRMNKKAKVGKMNPITAFVMGFGFSFAWTPCVGPALASVLILASNAKSVLEGNLLVLVYAIGFVIPFIFLGLFTGQTLNFIKSKPKVMDKIVKFGGVILIIMGLMLILGTFSKFEALFNPSDSKSNQKVEQKTDKNESESNKEKSDKNTSSSDSTSSDKSTEEANNSNDNSQGDSKKTKMLPIILKDQNGKSVDVGAFKGKVVFVNFFATWCPPCRAEIPDIQKLYEENGHNKKDVVVIGVTAPNMGRETDEAGVKKFIKDYNITYPVLMDTEGRTFGAYGVASLPTTFMIDKDGNIYGYATGGMKREVMDKIVDDALHKRPIKN